MVNFFGAVYDYNAEIKEPIIFRDGDIVECGVLCVKFNSIQFRQPNYS